mgnify:CR=1 FL=1
MQTEPANIESKQYENKYFLFNKAFFANVSSDIFNGAYWQEKEAITGQETGRGTTWFFQHNHHDLVLRHYLRGGLVSKLSKEHYIFSSWASCRSISEFQILNKLVQQGLPVPTPAAAQVIRSGLSYKADLITQRIPSAKDLVQILKVAQDENFYKQLGKTIARFHHMGVYHADLNIQNILQDKDQQFWLIDFDRARIMPPQQKWQLGNLSRLKRSFKKEKERFGIQWSEKDWDVLINAYESTR